MYCGGIKKISFSSFSVEQPWRILIDSFQKSNDNIYNLTAKMESRAITWVYITSYSVLHVNRDGKYMLTSQPVWLSFCGRKRAIDCDLIEICHDLIEIFRYIIVTNHITTKTGPAQMKYAAMLMTSRETRRLNKSRCISGQSYSKK